MNILPITCLMRLSIKLQMMALKGDTDMSKLIMGNGMKEGLSFVCVVDYSWNTFLNHGIFHFK